MSSVTIGGSDASTPTGRRFIVPRSACSEGIAAEGTDYPTKFQLPVTVTRRFNARPARVRFEAMGRDSPYPMTR